jgi:hypothetical protein
MDSLEAIERINEKLIKPNTPKLMVTMRNGIWGCPCGYNTIKGHHCADIWAVLSYIEEVSFTTVFSCNFLY